MKKSKLEIAEMLYQEGRTLPGAGKSPDSLDELPNANQKRFLHYADVVMRLLEDNPTTAAPAPAAQKMVLVNLPLWTKQEGREKITELAYEDLSPAAIDQADAILVLWPDNTFGVVKGSAKVMVSNATATNQLLLRIAEDLAWKLNNPMAGFAEGVRTTFETFIAHVGEDRVTPEVRQASEI